MKKKKKIHEGTLKRIYETDDPDQLILEFKDEGAPFERENHAIIKGKGAINNQISAFLFDYLEGFHIPTHYINTLSPRDMVIRRLEIIPVKVIVRNIATGSFCERYGIEDGKELDIPVHEYFLKDDSKNNPMINTSHVLSFGLASTEEIKTIDRFASKINAVLKSFFDRRNFRLVDFMLEFGRYKGKMTLSDEISPDTCRFWDSTTDEEFFNSEESTEKVYDEIKKRILKES